MILLSNTEIYDDIQAFKERILAAQSKLESLQNKTEGAGSWLENKRAGKQRRELIKEINHFYNLINIAQEALTTS